MLKSTSREIEGKEGAGVRIFGDRGTSEMIGERKKE